ncbi:hypothetical protein BC628DRAFT_972157 [Trametes gibbosa]|nr:hypothetical protein BC628DRAFT_972157 [Trametes gibbosa]
MMPPACCCRVRADAIASREKKRSCCQPRRRRGLTWAFCRRHGGAPRWTTDSRVWPSGGRLYALSSPDSLVARRAHSTEARSHTRHHGGVCLCPADIIGVDVDVDGSVGCGVSLRLTRDVRLCRRGLCLCGLRLSSICTSSFEFLLFFFLFLFMKSTSQGIFRSKKRPGERRIDHDDMRHEDHKRTWSGIPTMRVISGEAARPGPPSTSSCMLPEIRLAHRCQHIGFPSYRPTTLEH